MNLIIGNCFSFVGSLFTAASAWSRDKKWIYLFQVLQCLIIGVANIFFGSISGTTTMVLCAARNLLIAYDRFTAKLCAVFMVLLFVLGIAANTKGYVGLLPVVTTAVYTIGCFLAEQNLTIKLNMIVNLALWAVYDILIFDFMSFITDAVSTVLAVISIFKGLRQSPPVS